MLLGAGLVCDLPVNKYIRNVGGSAKDPLPFDSTNKHGWLGLWKKETKWDESVYEKVRCCTCGREEGQGLTTGDYNSEYLRSRRSFDGTSGFLFVDFPHGNGYTIDT